LNIDSILLVCFVKLNSKIKNIVDFGTNNAVITLILSKYTKSKITGVEIQEKAVDIANENIVLNNLSNQIQIVNDDIKKFSKNKNQEFDLILCNPPFFKKTENTKLKNISIEVANARHELLITLEEIIESASKFLKNGGIFAMVNRASRTGEIIELFYKYKIIPKKIMYVQPKINMNATTLLIEEIYMGNEDMSILTTLISHNEDGTYTKDLLKYFKE